MPHLEFGDKIVLPAAVLLELQCFKILTPMLFQIRAFARTQADDTLIQYCSVQEFSAPNGQAFVPYWIMQNLHINEGDEVLITNVPQLPRGIYCRLQPENPEFLGVAAEIGPKLLMESALRRYSVLSVNETILIDHGDKKFYVRVVEVRPGSAISILGDVDLEMDFAAPPSSDLRRPRSNTTLTNSSPTDGIPNPSDTPPHATTSEQEDSSMDSIPLNAQGGVMSTQMTCGRRLGDGGYVLESASPVGEKTRIPRLGTQSFRAAQTRRLPSDHSRGPTLAVVASMADTDALAKDIRQAQPAFSFSGHRLGGPPTVKASEERQVTTQGCIRPHQQTIHQPVLNAHDRGRCELCLATVPLTSIEMHNLRCVKNPAYHKVECKICGEHVPKTHKADHIHCQDCRILVNGECELVRHVQDAHTSSMTCENCGKNCTRAAFDVHTQSECVDRMLVCKLCGFKVKHREMEGHIIACGSRTERCEICQSYIRLKDLDSHVVVCISDRESRQSPVETATAVAAVNTEGDDDNQRHEMVTRSTSLAPSNVECAYCSKRGFTSAAHRDRHVSQECLVARSFRTPVPMGRADASSSVRAIVQGKVKRRGDLAGIKDLAITECLDELQRHRSGKRRGQQREPPHTTSNNRQDHDAHDEEDRARALVRLPRLQATPPPRQQQPPQRKVTTHRPLVARDAVSVRSEGSNQLSALFIENTKLPTPQDPRPRRPAPASHGRRH